MKTPALADDADERLDHIIAAALLSTGRFPAKNVGALFGVGRSTVYEWRNKALGYDQAEAEGLRRLIGR